MGQNSKYQSQEGLLFYLSGENGSKADFACGEANPTFFSDVEIIDSGVNGKAFECANTQLMAYKAPGNVYAQRGTISFFWRSRYPAGLTEFPIFRVAFADHSSWDQVFLRIDYNGKGIDAFVTDINLSRTRVSATLHPFPKPSEWLHIAFSWDENVGVKLYLNGLLVENKLEKKVLFAGLDQFGPHSRIISNWNVQSLYNFQRGGDIDEIRIYDRMLSDDNIAQLFNLKEPVNIPSIDRDLSDDTFKNEWMMRNGWDNAAVSPKYYAGENLSVKKVEIHDAYDLKRWWYKSMDGIRETTWPGVFNRSRLPGRNDYFQLPDWDCYYNSGKEITYHIPEEPWNHIEISGSAFGEMYLIDGENQQELAKRPRYVERSVHAFDKAVTGKKVKFVNKLIEEPIGDFSVFNVKQGKRPEGKAVQTYYINAEACACGNDRLTEVLDFVNGRYTPDERSFAVAGTEQAGGCGCCCGSKSLPFVNIAAAYESNAKLGLDGITLEIPALDMEPTHGGYILLNIQIKDPIWYYRNLANFTLAVKPGEAKTIWFDLRDRILPANKALYITIASSAAAFNACSLQGAKIEMVYKSFEEAQPEHELDRITQVRDIYGHLLEERPGKKEFNMYNRVIGDIYDILKYNPNHRLAQEYYYDFSIDVMKSYKNNEVEYKPEIPVVKPEFTQPQVPEGIEDWAHKQLEMLKRFKHVTDWWIENRQTENGELGGGLSDDGDQTGTWTALALMGSEPEKYKKSLFLETDEFYNQGMFVDGLAMIQADYLHSFEEGIQALSQCMCIDPGNPKYFERGMETTKAMFRITELNKNDERLFITSNYSGTKIAREFPWNVSEPHSYLVTGPAIYVGKYNGNPRAVQLIVELADALMNHYHDGVVHASINFDTGEETDGSANSNENYWSVLMAAYRCTGNEKYIAPLATLPFRTKPSNKGKVDKAALAKQNAAANEKMALREYINTDGNAWSDRLTINIKDAQYQRIGGVAFDRNYLYPLNFVSWKFENDSDAEKVGIYVSYGRFDELKVMVFNTTDKPVNAKMYGYEVNPGMWSVSYGVDANGDDEADTGIKTFEAEFENFNKPIDFSFESKKSIVITMKLAKPGVPYWNRCDIGICEDDITVEGNKVKVVVHGMGSVDSPATKAVVKGRDGKILATATVPAIKAPLNLFPKTAEIEFIVSGDLKDCYVELDPDNTLVEIHKGNNIVAIG